MSGRILVTGFSPYKEPMNASCETVRWLRKENVFGDNVVFEIIDHDVESREAESRHLQQQLRDLLGKYEPDVCLYTGQAPGRSKINIERFALNWFLEGIIDTEGKTAYRANLPQNEQIPGLLRRYGIPASHSNYAGDHLCNHILYSTLQLVERNEVETQATFIHIPVMPRQTIEAHPGSPSMDTPLASKGLWKMIESLLA